MGTSVPILLASAGGVLSHFVSGASLKINTATSAMVPWQPFDQPFAFFFSTRNLFSHSTASQSRDYDNQIFSINFPSASQSRIYDNHTWLAWLMFEAVVWLGRRELWQD
jgi:hypothetical protein